MLATGRHEAAKGQPPGRHPEQISMLEDCVKHGENPYPRGIGL